MKFVCSKGHDVKWRHKTCPTCNEGLGMSDYLRRSAKRILSGPLVYCPACGMAFPIGYNACPFCEAENSVPNAMNTMKKSMIEKVGAISFRKRRTFQRYYLLFSVIGLLYVFRHMADLDLGDWLRIGVVSIIYLATIALLLKWFVRRETVWKFVYLTSRKVKLSFICNYLCCLTLLQLAVVEWWSQFMGLAALVVMTYCGAWVFCQLFWPMSGTVKFTFLGDEVTDLFDSMSYQGRSGRQDGNNWGRK